MRQRGAERPPGQSADKAAHSKELALNFKLGHYRFFCSFCFSPCCPYNLIALKHLDHNLPIGGPITFGPLASTSMLNGGGVRSWRSL